VYTEWASVVEILWVCIQEVLGSDLGHIIHYSGWGCFGFPQACQAVIGCYLSPWQLPSNPFQFIVNLLKPCAYIARVFHLLDCLHRCIQNVPYKNCVYKPSSRSLKRAEDVKIELKH